MTYPKAWLCLLLTACGDYAEDVRTICGASELAEVSAASPESRSRVTAEYVGGHVRTREAKQLFDGLAVLSPEERVRRLAEATKTAGLASCPLADAWRAEIASAPPPAEVEGGCSAWNEFTFPTSLSVGTCSNSDLALSGRGDLLEVCAEVGMQFRQAGFNSTLSAAPFTYALEKEGRRLTLSCQEIPDGVSVAIHVE